MPELIRAVYEHGRLRLLDPVNLAEGQGIRLAIHSDRERVRMALARMLAPVTPVVDDDVDEAALVAMIDEEPGQGNVSLSDAIILFVGANNVGKTSLLEAVWLPRAPGNPTRLSGFFRRRPDFPPLLNAFARAHPRMPIP